MDDEIAVAIANALWSIDRRMGEIVQELVWQRQERGEASREAQKRMEEFSKLTPTN